MNLKKGQTTSKEPGNTAKIPVTKWSKREAKNVLNGRPKNS